MAHYAAAVTIKERAMITGISAVTLATHDMKRAVRFYRLLGLPLVHGGEEAGFTSFRATARPATPSGASASSTSPTPTDMS